MTGSPQGRLHVGGMVARGGIVLGASGLIDNAAQFIRAIVLARILSPTDFGLMGMAFVVVQASESLSQTGFYSALVQKRGEVEDYLDTVYTIAILRSVLLFGALWYLAPLVGLFFATPAAAPVLRGVAVGFLLQGLVNPALAYLEKDLHFVRYTASFVAGTLAELVGSIAFSLALRSVWGMVWGFVLGRVVIVIGSFLAQPRRPRLGIRRHQAVELYRYGRHISRAVAVDYVVSQLDRVLVGKLLGADPLGLYSFAARLASLPTTAAYKVVYGVAFPVFSKIQEDAARLRSGFLRAVGLMAALATPISAGLLAVSSDLVSVVFGEKWLGMTPPFRVLCAAGASMALYQLVAAIVRGVGKPELGARATYVFLGVIGVSLYPAIGAWGIVGAAWCMAVGGTAASLYLLATGTRVTGCRLPEVARVLAPSVIGSILMGLAVISARAWITAPPSWGLLVGECLAGALLYLGVAHQIDRLLGSGILASLRSMWRPM